jgi:UDP-N-acetylglucosamine diphosphorylase / glucose-1-phosphate thymidylyltransferase / UDP-N-acetylgalactosamine diphosphorylase / glucosamine-1-phosphate N-acetyltransferase / galactosamine-1-phosphate N-acetyltransferase
MAKNPTLIILAGGASSRMWPLREKSLLRFGDEPLLLSQLRTYESLGLHEVVIVGNPHNEADIRGMVDTLTDNSRVAVAIQPEAKGMGDALLRAAEHISGGAVYVTQVHDVVEDRLHADILAGYRADPSATYLAGVEMQRYFPGGYLIVGDGGRITGIIEKPGAENRPSNFVNIVAHIHADATALFDAIRAEYASANPADDHYERAMDALMKQMTYKLIPYAGRWDALKFPWHVLDVMDSFLRRIKGQAIAPSAFVAPTASIVGDVFIGENARIFPGAAVVGPAYIGAGTIVGNNALVRHSMVLENCNVGFTTEIARSYVADGCQMHACRVLDSVFAPNVNFSAGCTTANLRIDKKHIKSSIKGNRLDTGRDKFGAVIGEDAFLGVDVMTMPGVKIGEAAQVGPGTHVHEDVSDRTRIYVKQELLVIKDQN